MIPVKKNSHAARAAVRGVLLDLDGTLVDTAPDMGAALNQLLVENGQNAREHTEIRPVVSHGAKGLISLGFGEDVNESRFQELRARFLEIYAERVSDESRLFPGFESVLEGLRALRLRWGVVTNKPGWLTLPLLESLDLLENASCVISGDSCVRSKPHPMPLWQAACRLNMGADECLYVGDAQRDIDAGRAAGMRTLIAKWGYFGHDEDPEEWRADGLIGQPRHLLEWLQQA